MRRLATISLIALVLALPAVQGQADDRALIERQSKGFLNFLRDNSVEAAALLDAAEGVLVFPNMIPIQFGEGGRFGEGSLLVKGQPASYYVTSGEASDPEAQLLLFMDPTALAGFADQRSWHVATEPHDKGIIRLGWHRGDLHMDMPLAGSKFTRMPN